MSDAGWETIHGLKNVLEGQNLPIAKACQAVERCLELNRDNLRSFFEQCFALLLKQIFGYEGTSWLNIIAKGGAEADAKAVVDLLSPSGRLFAAMQSADADGLVKFIFPLERLPTHTQLLLASEAGRASLESWPQYRGHILVDGAGRCHVHLPVFHYFIFWTAFYVLRSSQAQTEAAPTRLPHLLPLTPSLGTVRRTLRLGRSAQVVEGHPYLRLLRLYLDYFLPRPGAGPAPPGPPGQPSGTGFTRLGPAFELRSSIPSLGQILLSVLLEFWLTDGNEPLGAVTAPSTPTRGGSAAPLGPAGDALDGYGELLGIIAPASSLRAVTFEPPSEDLLEAVTVLARYVTAIEQPDVASRPVRSAQAGSTAWLPLTPVQPAVPGVGATAPAHPAPARLGAAGRPAAQAFAVDLFRFMWRALTQWPEQRSTAAIVNVWVAYMAPWWVGPATTAEPGSPWRGGGGPGPPAATGEGLAKQLSQMSDFVQNALGESHVLPQRHPGTEEMESHFELAEWQAHVLANMPFYSVLLPAFLDLTLSRVSSRGDSALADLLKVLMVFRAAPELCSLIKAVEGEYARFVAHPTRRPEGRYADLVPFLLDQARDWAAAAAADCNAGAPLAVVPELAMFSEGPSGAALKLGAVLQRAKGAAREDTLALVRFTAAHFLPLDRASQNGALAHIAPALPLDNPKGLRLARWEDCKVKGDLMLRPMSDWEFHFVVRVLVQLSQHLNRRFNLPRQPHPDDPAPNNIVQKATRWLLSKRFNLRGLADKRNYVALFILYAVYRALRLLAHLIIFLVEL